MKNCIAYIVLRYFLEWLGSSRQGAKRPILVLLFRAHQQACRGYGYSSSALQAHHQLETHVPQDDMSLRRFSSELPASEQMAATPTKYECSTQRCQGATGTLRLRRRTQGKEVLLLLPKSHYRLLLKVYFFFYKLNQN